MNPENKRKLGLQLTVIGMTIMLTSIVLLVQNLGSKKEEGKKSSSALPISILPIGIALSAVGGKMSTEKPRS